MREQNIAKAKGSKGFIFSLDAMIAGLIALIAIMSISFYVSDVSLPDYQRNDLLTIGRDILKISTEKEIITEVIITGNESIAKESLTTLLPRHICSKLTIFNEHKVQLFSVIKRGCLEEKKHFVIARIPIVIEEEIYIGEAMMWYD